MQELWAENVGTERSRQVQNECSWSDDRCKWFGGFARMHSSLSIPVGSVEETERVWRALVLMLMLAQAPSKAKATMLRCAEAGRKRSVDSAAGSCYGGGTSWVVYTTASGSLGEMGEIEKGGEGEDARDDGR